jgi:hypothetical protein
MLTGKCTVHIDGGVHIYPLKFQIAHLHGVFNLESFCIMDSFAGEIAGAVSKGGVWITRFPDSGVVGKGDVHRLCRLADGVFQSSSAAGMEQPFTIEVLLLHYDSSLKHLAL